VSNQPFELTPTELSSEDCTALLQRIVESQELRRSARLRELLLYLGQRYIQGATSVREQEVGEAVFERPLEYDTTLDNIVRVNVSELRKRLAHYFDQEGAAEPVVLEIPRGGYLPVLLRRYEQPMSAETATSADEVQTVSRGEEERPAEPVSVAALTTTDSPANSAPHSPALSTGNSRSLLIPVLAVLLLCAGIACAVLQWQNEGLRAQLQPWKADPSLQGLWGQFFASGREVDIVSADSSYAMEEDLLGHAISLDDYLDYNYKHFSDQPSVDPATRHALSLILDRNSGSIGDFKVAARILALGGQDANLKLTSARSYSPESIKANDIILIGSRESNPWVELYKDRMNFYPEYDYALHRSYIVNRVPRPGEQPVYSAAEDRNRGYSVVVYLPNLSEHRNALIIAGTDSQATLAAGDFVTSSAGMVAIRKYLPAGPFPYFEVVLGSSRLVGTPLHTEILAVRVQDH
jgi:hypothetical protein